MKSLRDELYDIIYIHEMPAEHLNKALEELLQAVRERDSFCVGEDEKRGNYDLQTNLNLAVRDHLRSKIRQRQQQTLG